MVDASTKSAAGNLPVAGTAFFGRETDVARLRRHLASAAVPLTLVGAPGVGKTRLALRFAELEYERFAGGVWFTSLAEMRAPRDIVASVAATIGVPLDAAASDSDATEQLAYALCARPPLLLVLDNAEHGATATAALVRTLEQRAPEVRLLVTSREPLGIEHEVLHVVDTLDIAIGASLFIERARALRATFAPSADDERTIAEIVRRLDGLPLAIELAAARTTVLDPAGLLAHLSRRLDLLRSQTGGRGRQSSLRAALESSWETLPAALQEALARLSVFTGAFGAASAIAVLAAPDPITALDRLEALRRRSLVMDRTPPGGTPSFALLESVREFVAEAARGSDAIESAAKLHACHYAEVVERSPDATVDVDNLVAAHAHSLARDPELAARIALGLERTAADRRSVEARFDIIERTLAALGDGCRAELRAELVCARARIECAGGRVAAALDDARTAVALAERAGSRRLETAAHLVLAELHVYENRWGDAWAHAERALVCASGAGPAERVRVERFLGSLAALGHRTDEARTHLRRALVDAVASGDRGEEARVLAGLAELEQAVGRLAPSLSLREQSLALHRALGDRGAEGVALVNIAYTYLAAAEWTRAEHFAREARAILKELGQRRFETLALVCLGAALGRQKRLDEALQCARAAMMCAAGAGHYSVALATMSLAVVEAQRGAIEAARGAFDAARAIVAEVATPALATTLDVLEGFCDVALARAAGDAAARRVHWDRARARSRPPPDLKEPEPSDVRVVRRLLADELERDPDVDLRIERAGRWFERGGARVELAHKPVLRRLLLALANARIAHPGVPVAFTALLAAGWPGERVLPAAATRRLYVMMGRLRDAGLRDILQNDPDGYLLAAGVLTELVDDDDTG